MKTLPVGTAYAVWAGIGAVGTAILGIVLFAEPATAARLASIGLIVAGIVGLKLVSDIACMSVMPIDPGAAESALRMPAIQSRFSPPTFEGSTVSKPGLDDATKAKLLLLGSASAGAWAGRCRRSRSRS